MRPLRVFIVDDSAVIRKLLSEVLAADAEIEIAGTAGNGYVALARIPEVKPDLVTLDIEMPGMDGLATITEIRKLYPKLPVIMFSSFTERGGLATLEALSRGASDYVTKPNASSVEQARERVRAELIPKIKCLCSASEGLPVPAAAPPRIALPRLQSRIDIVAIGASTGGPNALVEVIPHLPADFPVPVLIVQHMPPLFTRLLAERINSRAPLSVREGEEGQRLQKGRAWIAPGDRHMSVVRKGPHFVLTLSQAPPENSCRPAVNVLFRSAAQAYGANVLGVVLTGMGVDGTEGARAIRNAGGEVFVQDRASSVVWGMPGSIVAAGLADRISPLNRIAADVAHRVLFRRTAQYAAYAATTK